MAEEELRTVVVLAAHALMRPDGRAAIAMDLAEAGTIAFVVDRRTIDELRRALTAAEMALAQGSGRA